MANIKFRNVGIKAVSACVPKRIEKIDSLTEIFSRDEAEKFSRTTGIYERRIADENICTSDLCFAAAKKLMEENGISADSVDVLLFMSKTPDFITPSTSALLQSRLGLSKKTLCMDLRLACSGYVYALSAAYAYASMDGVNRVLLLTGDVNSKIVSRKSRAECPVFGDGGSATLVEKGDFADSFFDFGTDGSRGDFIVIPCENGGRNRVAENSLQNKTDDDGNERNSLQMHMSGMDVFGFAISTVPKNISSVLNFAGKEISSVDKFLIHQVNGFILQTIARKMKITMEKIPMNIDRYGNTSSASIPLLMSTEFHSTEFHQKAISGNILLSGFGSGLSWGSMVQETDGISVCSLTEI